MGRKESNQTKQCTIVGRRLVGMSTFHINVDFLASCWIKSQLSGIISDSKTGWMLDLAKHFILAKVTSRGHKLSQAGTCAGQEGGGSIRFADSLLFVAFIYYSIGPLVAHLRPGT